MAFYGIFTKSDEEPSNHAICFGSNRATPKDQV